MKLVFLDARELARRFKVCRRTIGRWLSLGLPYYVLGRRRVRPIYLKSRIGWNAIMGLVDFAAAAGGVLDGESLRHGFKAIFFSKNF